MEKKTVCLIPGTVHSVQNGQLLISSGIKFLDCLLDGGFAVGTVVLVEEDIRGHHSKVLLKHFLAEGLASTHSMLIASQDVNPSNILRELPTVIDSDPEADAAITVNNHHQQTISDDMKIAFRYQNVSSNQAGAANRFIGHHFDLSKHISFSDIENSDIYYWSGQRIVTGTGVHSFTNPAYNDLLKSIKQKIKEGKFFVKDNSEKKTILRIGIHSLGSAMWLPTRKTIHTLTENSQDLHMFIFCLRALVRSAHAVAFVTIPSYLYDKGSLERCIHSSDIAMKLQSFSGTELEKNHSLRDHHGFFFLTKLAAINSLSSKQIGAVEYVFRLKKKKFCIDVLHLPPNIGDNADQNRGQSSSLSCGGVVNNRLLEF